MQKVITINLNGNAFQLDEDGYEALRAYLGDAKAYTRIFEANRDQLSDPDKIKPGQVLKIPAMDRQLG